MLFFDNAYTAIQAGNARRAPCIVAYRKGKGWFLYDPAMPALARGDEAEMLCRGAGKMPVPISEYGRCIIAGIIAKNA